MDQPSLPSLPPSSASSLPREPSSIGLYMVHLKETHGSSTLTTLVSATVWDWVHAPYQGNGHGMEPVPSNVLVEFRDHQQQHVLDDGCLDVDAMNPVSSRALCAPGVSFDDLREALSHVQSYNVQILDRYEGLLG